MDTKEKELRIRTLEKEDLPCCAAILRAVYNNPQWQCRWSEARSEKYLLDLFQMPGFLGFVLEAEEGIAGAVFARRKVWWNNDEIFLEELFVLPPEQGKGYGGNLLAVLERVCRENGLAGLTLSTARHSSAPEFYRKRGFSDGEHVLFMYKVLG